MALFVKRTPAELALARLDGIALRRRMSTREWVVRWREPLADMQIVVSDEMVCELPEYVEARDRAHLAEQLFALPPVAAAFYRQDPAREVTVILNDGSELSRRERDDLIRRAVRSGIGSASTGAMLDWVRREIDISVRATRCALSRARETGPSAVASAPAARRGAAVYCQSQFDPEE